MATGRVEQGRVRPGDELEIVGLGETTKTVVTSIEAYHRQADCAEAGDSVGLLLRGIKRDEIRRGQVLARPGSTRPFTKFRARVYVLKKEEGGRHTPFFNNYRPQFFLRTTNVTGSVRLAEGQEMVMPGDNTTIEVELDAAVAMNQGLEFAIREGGRTVGSGVVAAVTD